MFETAVLSYGPPTKRVWATCAGFTGQALLIGFALLAPMIWPQTIPRVVWSSITLVPPSPPPPPPPPPGDQAAPRRARVVPFQSAENVFRVPSQIPAHPMMIVEEPEVVAVAGRKGGVPGGMEGGVENGVLHGILTQVAGYVPPPKPVEVMRESTKTAPAPATVAKPPRISVLQLATPIHRVDPVYPNLAKQARISGVVELVGVLGVDGRIHELRVVRGHPLLLEAAMAAVKQWVYAPTMLNGQPVEVQAPIQVNFILNR
jgi:protein TonB